MLRIWRLFRVFMTTLVYTSYVSLVVRRRPPVERPRLRAHHQKIGAGLLCRAMGVRVSMQGAPPAGQPMLYVSNHLGVLDPLVLASQMPLCIVGKAELSRWPYVGWMCRTYGLLFIDRERRTAAGALVEQIQEKLREGVSVLVFPEGTTGWGDVIQPFKTGVFQAVAERDEAALPLYLNVQAVNGEPTTGGQLPDITRNGRTFVEHALHLLSLKRVDIQVCVGQPLTTDGLDRKALARLAYQAVNGLKRPSLVEKQDMMAATSP